MAIEKQAEVIDYMHLPPPIKYEELQRESMSALTLWRLYLYRPLPAQTCMHDDRAYELYNLQLASLHPVSDSLAHFLRAVTLKPELFEGLRFDFTKPLNQNFALCHR